MAGRRASSTPTSPAREAATRIVQALRREGFVAYLAGGCVRDEVMGLAPKDYDVATDARPERVRQIFRNTQAVGEHFGVILVRESGCTVEVATFRHESGYSDCRRPDTVTFTDAEGDARRRDFTINGLFLDPVSGEVIDFVGGQADIHAGLIRAIGDPAARLGEDHLRALRAVRFAARFDFRLDESTAEAIRRDAAELRGVSRERIGQEIRLMLLDRHRARAMALLADLGLDAPVLEAAHSASPPVVLGRLTIEESLESALIVAAGLAAWAIDRGEATPGTPSRWRRALMLSNLERDALAAVLRDVERIRSQWPAMSVARRKRLAAGEWFAPVRMVLRAAEADLADAVEREIADLSTRFGGLAPPPLVTGDDLVAAGFPPGPPFKQALDAVYDAQLEGRIETHGQAMDYARRLLTS